MASPSLNDQFIMIQMELKKLREEGNKSEDIHYHYESLANSVEQKMTDLIGQSLRDISNFKSLIKDLKGEFL